MVDVCWSQVRQAKDDYAERQQKMMSTPNEALREEQVSGAPSKLAARTRRRLNLGGSSLLPTKISGYPNTGAACRWRERGSLSCSCFSSSTHAFVFTATCQSLLPFMK